jgi:hypothetical protein
METQPTKRFVFTAFVTILLLSLAGCNFIAGDSEVTARETELRETEMELMVRETLQARQTEPAEQNTPEAQQAPTEDLQATKDAQASQTAASMQTQAAVDAGATETQAAAFEQNATAEAIQQSTAQAEEMSGVIQQLYTDGIISQEDGAYFRLEDFDQSVAQIDYLFTYSLNYEVENFVISAIAKWSSASDTANWPTSGCGFYYSKKSPDEFTLGATSLRLDGFGLVQQWVKGNGKALAAKKASNVTVPEGQAEIMLVVYDQRATFFVNGSQVVTAYDGLIGPGDFGYTISSGTNAGFGTRCQLSEINLWIFE